MTTPRDPDTILAAWLDEGPTDLPDATRRAILTALPTTNQARRGPLAPWRLFPMNSYSRLAAAVFVAVIAVGGALYILGRQPGVGGQTSTPTVSPAPPSGSPPVTAQPSMPLDTTRWIPFAGSLYGYSVAYPLGWQTSAATEVWAGQTSYDMWVSSSNAPWADKTYDFVTGITMTGLATTVPAGTTEEAWIDAYLVWPPGVAPTGATAAPPCIELAKDMMPIVIDGHPARRTTKCGGEAAFVFVGNRMFVFEVSSHDELPLLNAYLSTITLPAATPSPT